MVYEINKSRDLKKRTGNHIWKKFLNLWKWQKKEYPDILGIFAVSLNPIIIQNWIKKKEC